MNDWERVERIKDKRASTRGATREEISYTNKSYMNPNQLSLEQGKNRNKGTIAGEDNMTWDL